MLDRIVLIVLDSVGVGNAPDAAEYGDAGANTVGHIVERTGLTLPNMEKIGFGHIEGTGLKPDPKACGAYGRLTEASRGKDTTTGHWEMAGLTLHEPFPTYPNGFPPEVIEAFEKAVGRGTLGNKPASGTAIIKELGEDAIRQKVGEEFRAYLEKNPYSKSYYLYGGKTVEQAEKEVLDEYIDDISKNYGTHSSSTDFSLYVDDKVKVFGKDLKEYDGTTLTYVAVMPRTVELADYIKNLRASDLQKTIDKLVPLENGNFKEGVATKIVGYIPKFSFEYSLPLMDRLKEMGITDVFDAKKANLSGMTDAGGYISTALHKANIDFTQDGIKAAAATFVGGLGAGDMFDYLYDVPVEEIDMTFDRPYLFLIADKNTGDVWFAGAVYEPLLWSEEPESKSSYYRYSDPVPYDYESYIWSGSTRND